VPAVLSGRLAAESILDGGSYRDRLRTHPVLADYRRVHRLLELARRKKGGVGAPGPLAKKAIARGFAWMFSGARLPAPRLIDAVMEVARVR